MIEHATRALEGLRTLVVEDNLLVGMSIASYLRSFGCEVVAMCSTSADAMNALARGDVEVALLDVNILGGTSEDVARALVERRVPFMFITGYSSPPLLASDLRQRPRLNKPVNPLRLQEAIVRCVGGEGTERRCEPPGPR